ncbi:MAG: hypothetical protein JWN08_2760 [Frankiales bacterium]|nr:hypothetical protein [Frankiales bacterium]
MTDTAGRGHDELAGATARWVVVLFALGVVLQRFAVPTTDVALLIPVVLLWCGHGVRKGLLTVDRGRTALWLAAFGATALTILAQARFVPGSTASITSWGLFLVVWAPFVLRVVDARSSTYLLMLRGVARVGLWLAVGCVAMTGSQLLGQRYTDWFADVVPPALQLPGFVITYPVAYGSELYRANAWIGLEPSFVSAQLGLALLAGAYTGLSAARLSLLLLALACTVSGSGFALMAVGLLVVLAHPLRAVFVRYLPLVGVTLVAAASTDVGTVLLERVTEFQSSGSSTSLRAIEPYSYLWPVWVEDSRNVLLGLGPGSAQDLVSGTRILGLLVPSPAKVFFEYGLLAGAVLAAFLLACYVGGPSRGFSLSLLLSLWLIQPGTTTLLAVLPLMVFVTLWSPRPGLVVELQPALLSRRARSSPRPGRPYSSRPPGALAGGRT